MAGVNAAWINETIMWLKPSPLIKVPNIYIWTSKKTRKKHFLHLKHEGKISEASFRILSCLFSDSSGIWLYCPVWLHRVSRPVEQGPGPSGQLPLSCSDANTHTHTPTRSQWMQRRNQGLKNDDTQLITRTWKPDPGSQLSQHLTQIDTWLTSVQKQQAICGSSQRERIGGKERGAAAAKGPPGARGVGWSIHNPAGGAFLHPSALTH